MHRARAAQTRAAAELGPGQMDMVPDHPEQWGVRIGVDGHVAPVDAQIAIGGSFLVPRDPSRLIDCALSQ